MARIAVIGAGMGAMAAAARLAVAGHRVAVFERGATHGGALRQLARDGFAFDTGPGLLHLPAVYRDLFLKTGREPLESCVELTQVDPAARHVFADGTAVSLPNASRAGVLAALDEALGAGAGERWSDLVGRAREAWDATRRPLLEEPLWQDWQVLGRDPYPAVRKRGLFGRGKGPTTATLAEVARRELADPRLIALLESHALAYGFDPRSAPAGAVVLPYMEQTFGSWYPRGGMRALADALYERCVARKVEFSFGTAVTGIVEKDGRAAGVELADGRVSEAEFVVAGVDPVRLVELCQGRQPWGADDVRPDPVPGDRATGRLTVCLALRGARPGDAAHRTVVHAADRAAELAGVFGDGSGLRTPCDRPTVTVLRPDDPATRPDDAHEAVTLTATVAPHGPVDWTDGEAVAADAERMTEIAEAAVPGLRDRVLWREVLPPTDDALVPGPALAGQKGRFLRPANRTRIPGLYAVGGWSHPGGGPAHAGMSGAIVAGLIVNGDEWRGSS
ncbi:NAD(P)/FAD-dependent oxidoreductase [Streptomyces lydicamycinicus]|uniref:Putative carotenoid dehydrogenase n=1 Tax=Streptomyces lydicamycinicus TaxID=1546107 RepID=A0A0P4RHA3_9ACTN|nr:NAD(P)/FAD-dependent oxidoreductase [Streptomyces lydicamycinicus]USA03565.1 NAD(P)/FAD-dependent oxidoreductase [Streptomyces lydicamycinicus]GAO12713.1 putative carotenoid dehydrogenase [Streptomyces lydicamycinicus]